MKPYWSLSLILLFLHVGVFCSSGQAIRIASAYYGSTNGVGVDVTGRVQQFADYGEPFRVGKETLRIDPSPNHRKALVVIYEVNGQRISDCVPEGDVFYFRNGTKIGANREDDRPAIRVIKAVYGAQGRYVDVTNQVRELARMQRPFTVSNQTFCVDPDPGRQKWLKISYLRGSTSRLQRYAEGDHVQLW